MTGETRSSEEICAYCAGFDIEWMYSCSKHRTKFCRGCACPECAEEDVDGDDLSEEQWAREIAND